MSNPLIISYNPEQGVLGDFIDRCIIGNYKGLHYACTIQTCGCPLLHRPISGNGIDPSTLPQGCGIKVLYLVKSPLSPTYPRTGGGRAYNLLVHYLVHTVNSLISLERTEHCDTEEYPITQRRPRAFTFTSRCSVDR